MVLDGQEVDQAKLEEAKANQATRVVETKSGEFKTLTKLHGKDD